MVQYCSIACNLRNFIYVKLKMCLMVWSQWQLKLPRKSQLLLLYQVTRCQCHISSMNQCPTHFTLWVWNFCISHYGNPLQVGKPGPRWCGMPQNNIRRFKSRVYMLVEAKSIPSKTLLFDNYPAVYSSVWLGRKDFPTTNHHLHGYN